MSIPYESTVDISAAIERQQINTFLVRLVALSLSVAFFDGFDQNLISFAAPAIVPAFHLSPAMIGNVFSVGLIGSMLGGFLFGAMADRLGRRPAMISATVLFGVSTLATALVTSYASLLAARFVTGIGTGGLLPVCWTLNIEYVPKRFRSSIVTVIMLGYSAGASLGGPIALCLIPRHGWQSVFVFAGALSLFASGALIAFQPESIRFLAARGRASSATMPILRRIAPTMYVPDHARFILGDEEHHLETHLSRTLLFHGELRWVTPVLWFANIFSSIATFFLTTWTPLVFEAMKLPHAVAAAAGSITAVTGALGGLALMRFTDARGAIALAAMPAMAVPVLLIGGFVNVGPMEFLVLIGLIAFALIGGHIGLNSIAGVFYPSALRATGAGWATAVGKIGSIVGPFLGGVILSTSLPTRVVFGLLAICPAMLLICLLVIGRMQSRMLIRERQERLRHGANIPAVR